MNREEAARGGISPSPPKIPEKRSAAVSARRAGKAAERKSSRKGKQGLGLWRCFCRILLFPPRRVMKGCSTLQEQQEEVSSFCAGQAGGSWGLGWSHCPTGKGWIKIHADEPRCDGREEEEKEEEKEEEEEEEEEQASSPFPRAALASCPALRGSPFPWKRSLPAVNHLPSSLPASATPPCPFHLLSPHR